MLAPLLVGVFLAVATAALAMQARAALWQATERAAARQAQYGGSIMSARGEVESTLRAIGQQANQLQVHESRTRISGVPYVVVSASESIPVPWLGMTLTVGAVSRSVVEE